MPESIAPLDKLASNLRWSWHRGTRALFAGLNLQVWEACGQDPMKFLGAVTRDQLQDIAADPALVTRIAELGADLDRYLEQPRWYQGLGADAPASVAYFSPEYGISAVLPQYSGGLGILAGDHLKSASDLGVPMIGVGLLYAAGYFKQSLSQDAWQQETYPVLDPDELPLTQLVEADGTPAQVRLPLSNGRMLCAHIWRADVGRVPLLLLDSNVPDNDEAARTITDRLYGGGGDHRLQQELLLGIGGVKALRIFERLTGTPAPEVFHSNEGHAGFLGVERMRELMDPPGGTAALEWQSALQVVRAGTLFTTHTPVPAGIDRFDIGQVRHFFDAGLTPGVPTERILGLGAENYAGGDPSTFNMAVMGLRLAQRANGVAKLHGRVSREMFAGLWPGFDPADVPIGSVTNGVHIPTWVDPLLTELARADLGSDTVVQERWEKAYDVEDARIWALRRTLRSQLVAYVRRRLRSSWRKRGDADAQLAWTDTVLDPDVLTIGFARRVPTYKRLTLMLRDPARLKALLLDPERPIQIVVAGKSHPADEQGKRMIQDLVRFTDDPEVRHRIVFLPNYDIAMARTLFPGCDVWLNNPLRPLEACGTSGMKSAINGGLNLSVLDGWWDEMYDGENGWAIPTANLGADPDERDKIESAALYDLLEDHVVPRFYGTEVSADAGAAGPSQVTGDGVPHQWVAMIKHTLAVLGPAVSAERMLVDYVTDLYRPACASRRRVIAGDYAAGKELAAYVDRVEAGWAAVQVEHIDSVGLTGDPQIGDTLRVNAYIRLGELTPGDISVEAAFGRVSESDELTGIRLADLGLAEELDGGRFLFSGEIVINRSGSFGYTVRVLPRHELLASRAELGLIVNAG